MPNICICQTSLVFAVRDISVGSVSLARRLINYAATPAPNGVVAAVKAGPATHYDVGHGHTDAGREL